MEGVRTNCLVVVAIDSKVLFQSLISSFSLSITFGMISGSEVSFMSHAVPRDREVGYEFHTPLEVDMAWDTVLGKDM